MLSTAHMARIEQAISEVAIDRFGADARRSSVIVDAVRRLSDRYLQGRSAAASAPGEGQRHGHDLLAQLCFFTPADLPKVAFALAELAPTGLPPAGDLRLLDVGAGCGAQTLGIAIYLAAIGGTPRILTVDALDLDAGALELMERVLRRLTPWLGDQGITLRLHTERGDLRQRRATSRPYDLITVGSMLAEVPVESHATLAGSLLDELSDRGVLLLLEPALRDTTRALHQLRDQLVEDGAWWILAPCTHQRRCSALEQPGDWCHELRVWQPPPRLRGLAAASGLRRRDLKWSYVALARPCGRQPSGWPFRVVSSVIRTKGKREVFVCGEAGRLRLIRLDRHASDSNADFTRLRRGLLVQLEGGSAIKGDTLRVVAETRVRAFDPSSSIRLVS